jgi:cell division protein FtsX
MKTLLIVLAVLVVVGVGLGFYLGWFNLSSRSDKAEPNVTLSVDKAKIEADKDKVVEKAKDLGGAK